MRYREPHVLRRLPTPGKSFPIFQTADTALSSHYLRQSLPSEGLACPDLVRGRGFEQQKALQGRTKVERARSSRGVMCYAGKKYRGKEVVLPPGWKAVGCFWDALNRKHLPHSRIKEFTMTKEALHRFRRVVRRYFASKGRRWKAKNGITLYTQEHLQWARAMDWAEAGNCQPVDFSVPLTGLRCAKILDHKIKE
jgi:hypothetical protein